jgi:hypothetical protein
MYLSILFNCNCATELFCVYPINGSFIFFCHYFFLGGGGGGGGGLTTPFGGYCGAFAVMIIFS